MSGPLTSSSISACLVLLSSTVIQFLAVGILKSLGVLLPALREQFVIDTWAIGLTISLIPGIGSIACLFLPLFQHLLDPGCMVMITGLLTGIGFIFGSLATHILVLVLAFIVTGVSVITEVIATGILPIYFEEQLHVAISISMCGVAAGLMVMPVITQLFLDTYGWRGAMMLTGALCLHITACGALIKHCELQRIREKAHKLSDDSEYYQLINSEDNVERNNSAKPTIGEQMAQMCTYFFKNVAFIGPLIASACQGFSFVSWVIYLIPHGEERGVSPARATLLATVGGFGNLLAKLFGYTLSSKILSKTSVMYLSATIAGISLIVDSQFPTLAGMVATAVVFGFACGINMVALLVLVNDVVEKQTILIAYGWIYFLHGLAALAGGYLNGWLFDVTGSYNASFIVMGLVFLTQPCYFVFDFIWHR